ncbi:hypothetical protein KHC23_05960 [Ancylobacter dichloromethanicus]|uniref:Uncharacterized protein n=1 Tax=Ancylobacter dichloromethanicus TaxID=518825 RepID=A0A9W6MZQ4_9HYPH|nr:hypothetical protein [Ancylobacter dichloromethanicus]MBS7553192.1 hypothetical protein [Ancylobacter dichloromethanicus]GLK72969.1 hypothetical protein GCM10017643_30850 [Ancylobacter dichloromethanicus]
MNSNINSTMSRDLRELYSTDDSARRVFAWFDERRKDSRAMPVRIAAYRTGLDEREIRRVFKLLDEIGCGRYIKGRGENESRMAWTLSIRSIASAAKGESFSLEEVAVEPEDTLEAEGIIFNPDEPVIHTFKLRSDFEVKISLPSDFTDREADRLGAFLKAIPIS